MVDKKRLFTQKFKALKIDEQDLTIRQLRGFEAMRITTSKDDTQDKQTALMIALFLGDESGERVFNDLELDKIGELPLSTQLQIVKEGSEYNFASLGEKKT